MEKLLNVHDVACQLDISTSTIYANPAHYRMFKVGGLLRTTQKDINDFIAESREKHNNVMRLALGVGKQQEVNKCRYSRGMVSTILTSEHPAVSELKGLLG